jgi:hypothetical protein
VFEHVKTQYPASTDQDFARYEVIKDTIEKSKEIKTIEDKYLKGVAKWNSALAGAAVFGIVDRVTNFTERASEGIRDRFVETPQGPTAPPTDETPSEEQAPGQEQPPVEQPPITPETTQEGILVQDGRVNLEGSAWHSNLGGNPQGNLPGGATNHSNFAGGTHEMAPFLLENDLQELGVTRDNLINTLETGGVHQLLNEYHSRVYNGATDPDLVDILKNMGERGQALLDTVNN